MITKTEVSLKLSFSVIFLFFIHFNTYSQSKSPVYTVVFVRGNVLLHPNANTSKPLTVKQKIHEKSSLSLKENSQLILKDSKQRFCVLETANFKKIVQYKTLPTIFKSQENTGMINSILAFMSKEIGKPSYNIRDYAEDNMQKKGGVSRSGCTIPLMQFPVSSQKIVDTSIVLLWNREENITNYFVEIYQGDEFEGQTPVTLFNQLVIDTSVLVSFGNFGKDYLNVELNWVVYPQDQRRNCARYYFTIINEEKYREILSEVEKNLISVENKEDQLLQKAFLLESNGLIDDASLCFNDLNTNYGKQVYKDLYVLFKIRNGIY
jgi:hypothetical protein